MSVQQYELWLADLDPQFGTEPGKRRPVIIVQTNDLNDVSHGSTIILPISSNVHADVSLLRLNLTAGTAGLNKASAILIDQFRAIDNRRFGRKLGELPRGLVTLLKERIRIVLDLDI